MVKVLRLLVVAVLVAGAAGGIYAWVGSKGGRRQPASPWSRPRSAPSPRRRWRWVRSSPGSASRSSPRSRASSHRCFVEVGDRVQAGEPLFEISPDPTPQELLNVDHSVRSAEASFGKARGDFERGVRAVRGRPDVEGRPRRPARDLRAGADRPPAGPDNRDLTRQRPGERRRHRGRGHHPHPASGTVLSRAVDVGDPVVPLTSYQPGTELASVADMDDLIFKGTVDEIDVGKIGRDAVPDQRRRPARPVVTGRLARIAPQAQKSEGATLFDVEIELDPEPGGGAAGRLLGQRRRGDPREARHPARSPSAW
jgi:hypothetical protein